MNPPHGMPRLEMKVEAGGRTWTLRQTGPSRWQIEELPGADWRATAEAAEKLLRRLVTSGAAPGLSEGARMGPAPVRCEVMCDECRQEPATVGSPGAGLWCEGCALEVGQAKKEAEMAPRRLKPIAYKREIAAKIAAAGGNFAAAKQVGTGAGVSTPTAWSWYKKYERDAESESAKCDSCGKPCLAHLQEGGKRECVLCVATDRDKWHRIAIELQAMASSVEAQAEVKDLQAFVEEGLVKLRQAEEALVGETSLRGRIESLEVALAKSVEAEAAALRQLSAAPSSAGETDGLWADVVQEALVALGASEYEMIDPSQEWSPATAGKTLRRRIALESFRVLDLEGKAIRAVLDLRRVEIEDAKNMQRTANAEAKWKAALEAAKAGPVPDLESIERTRRSEASRRERTRAARLEAFDECRELGLEV